MLSHTPVDQLVLPKVVFIDWDNTLTNSWPFLLRVMNKTITAFGKDALSMDEFRNLPNINMPQAEIIKGIFGEEHPDIVDSYWRNYQEERLKSPLDMDGYARKLLKFLKDHHIFVAIVSNQEQAVLEENIKQSGLREYINSVVGAIRGQPEKNKPMVGAIQRALVGSPFLKGQTNTPHNNWWFVGDGDSDIKTALNSACFPVWVEQYAIRPTKFSTDSEVPNGLKVDSLQALLKILERINSMQHRIS